MKDRDQETQICGLGFQIKMDAECPEKNGYKYPKQSLINVTFQNARNKEKRLQLSGELVGRHGIKNQFAYVELGVRDFRLLKIIPAARRQ